MADLLPLTREEVINELEAEVKMRHQVFGRWVKQKKMTQDTKERRIARIEQAIEWLRTST